MTDLDERALTEAAKPEWPKGTRLCKVCGSLEEPPHAKSQMKCGHRNWWLDPTQMQMDCYAKPAQRPSTPEAGDDG